MIEYVIDLRPENHLKPFGNALFFLEDSIGIDLIGAEELVSAYRRRTSNAGLTNADSAGPVAFATIRAGWRAGRQDSGADPE